MAKLYQRKNSPYWWCKYKSPTEEIKRVSTKVPIKFKAQASLRASQMEADDWDLSKQGKRSQSFLFEEGMVEWLKGTKPGDAEKNCITRLRLFFGGKDLGSLAGQDVEDYKTLRGSMLHHDKLISNSTIRRELTTFSAALNWLIISRSWDIPNPVTGRKPLESQSRIRWIDPSEANTFILKSKNNPRAKWLPHFVALGFNTGMRKMEMLACSIDRIDLANSCIHLRPEDQKNGQHGSVALNRAAKEAIIRQLTYAQKRYPGTQWLFPSRIGQGEFHMAEVRKPFDNACAEAGITNFTPHDMRHTFASWLVQRGVPLLEVKEVLMHSSVRQTEKYAHLAQDTSKRVVDSLDNVYELAHYRHTNEFDSVKGGNLIEKILLESTL